LLYFVENNREEIDVRNEQPLIFNVNGCMSRKL